MAKKLLAITKDQNEIKGMLFIKRDTSLIPEGPQDISNTNDPTLPSDSLIKACRAADEIFISDTFMSAQHYCGLFQKLDKANTAALLHQDALERMNTIEDIHVRFSTVREVDVDGIRQPQISYISAYDKEIQEIWDLFKGFTKKIKGIGSLPSCLAATASGFGSPQGDFLTVWLGKTQSTITVSAPGGEIKVSRTFPFEMGTLDFSNPGDVKRLAVKVDREINLTVNFFKRTFREPDPETVFLFGSDHLERVLSEHPLSSPVLKTRFSLPNLPVQESAPGGSSGVFDLIATLFLPDAYIFFPRQLLTEKKANRIFYPVCAVLGITIAVLIHIWLGLQSDLAIAGRKLSEKAETFDGLHKDVDALEERNKKWQPYRAWKEFYDLTFHNNPSWNRIISDLGRLTPDSIVLSSMSIMRNPGDAGANKWLVTIGGEVHAYTWQDGLKQFREFGTKLQLESPFFSVTDLRYTPEDIEKKSNIFKFNMMLNLKTMVSLNE